MSIIQIGTTLNTEEAIRINRELQQVRALPELVVSFSDTQFSRPFGTLLLSCGLREVRDYRAFLKLKSIEFRFDPNAVAMTYLAHMGFFQFVGVDFGKHPGEASGGENYIPLQNITRKEVESRKASADEPVGSPVSKLADQLALVLTRSNDFKRYKPISYCIRETVRNVFEHSGAEQCYLIGQGWKDGTVEIGIADTGMGICRSLAPRYGFGTDEEALEWAIRPGISRASRLKDDPSPWANSGFGLYVLSELGLRLGTFSLLSGDSRLVCEDGAQRIESSHFSGTAVQLRIRRPHGRNFEEFISEIVQEGEEQDAHQGASRAASLSTKSLTL